MEPFFIYGVKRTNPVQTENLVGKVSFVSSQNIYVRFKSCEGISVGDTLYIPEGDTLVPALIVNSLSSVSCLCSSLSDHPVPARSYNNCPAQG